MCTIGRMRFSQRSAPDRTENRLTVLLRRTRTHREVLDLTESNPTRAAIAYDREAILAALADARSLSYDPHPLGLPSARAAVASELSRTGIGVHEDDVVLTASTSEAYGFLFKLFCDPGDEVLVPQPSYPLFELLAGFESVRLVPYRLAYDGEWHIDMASVRRAIGERTRAILLVSPNNPTGSYVKRDELRALASLGLPLISDEVFARYTLDDSPHRAQTVLEADAELLFALGGLSKHAGLPQVKLGWIAIGGAGIAAAEARGRLELLGDTWLSVSTPAQIAAPALLASAEVAQRAIHARVAANLAELRRVTEGSAIGVLRVEGGWYATLRLPNVHDAESFCALFLEEDSVWTHPGFLFDFEEEAYVVVSLLTPPEVFVEGVHRIVRRVARVCR